MPTDTSRVESVSTPAEPLFWGVDTSKPVTADKIAEMTDLTEKPSFWGRYLPGYELKWEEVTLLHNERIPIVPIYQETTQHWSELSGAASGRCGSADAARAAQRAKEYGIPNDKRIAIYADIEPEYDVSQHWLEAWISGVSNAGYLAGLYVGSNQPGIIEGMRGLSGVHPSSIYIWSCMPHITTHVPHPSVPVALGAPGLTMSDGFASVDMWQYSLEYPYYDEQNTGDYDFNVATQRAFNAMWLP